MADTEDEGTKIENLDLSLLLPEEQFPFYADEFSKRHVSMDISQVGDREDFPFKLSCLDNHSTSCTYIYAPPHKGVRSQELVKKDPSGDCHLIYAVSGTTNVEFGDTRHQYGEQDLYLYNVDIPYSAASVDPEQFSKFLVFYLPENKMRNLGLSGPEVFGKHLNFHSYAPLFKNVAANLQKSLAQQNKEESELLFSMCTSLIDFIVAGELASEEGSFEDQAYHVVQMEVLGSMSNPNYSLVQAAGSLGVTTERLEQILSRRDTSFADLLSESRIAFAVGQFTDPASSGKTIEDIARSAGFASMEEFYAKVGRSAKSYFRETRHLLHGKPSRTN